jgi:hypothetical protein
MRLKTERQKAAMNLSQFVASTCRLLSLDTQLVFDERFAILDRARVTPYFNKVFAARQNLAECCAKCFVCANRLVASGANPVISSCC